MARGDHIRVRRLLYSHHGIDCGDGTVIHYTGTLWKRREAAVVRTPLDAFARDKAVAILRYKHPSPPEEVLARAESRLSEQKYDIVFNNCEHFASWCVTGQAQSRQVRVAVTAVSAAVVAIGGILMVVARKSPGGSKG